VAAVVVAAVAEGPAVVVAARVPVVAVREAIGDAAGREATVAVAAARPTRDAARVAAT
jgi:hypothetical protein